MGFSQTTKYTERGIWMGVLPVNVILASDPKVSHSYTEEQFSELHKKLRGTIAKFLLKIGMEGEFKSHLFSDQGTNKRSGGHQEIWLEGQDAKSVVFAVRPDGREIYLVRLRVPEGDDSSQRKFRSTIALALEPKKPADDPPDPLPPAPPAPPPPPPSPTKKRKFGLEPTKGKKTQGGKFSVKEWLSEAENLIRVLLTFRNFLEKKDNRYATGKVLVAILRHEKALPENHSPKSFNLVGKLLEGSGYLETVTGGVRGKEKFFRLTPLADELLKKCLGNQALATASKPPVPAEAIREKIRGQQVAEALRLISVQLAGLASSFEQLAKLQGGDAG